MKLLLLNGPPRSGKDTAAEIALDYYRNTRFHISREHEKFSQPLKEAFAAITDTHCPNFVNTEWESRKEDIVPSLGVSYRQFQIDLSEKFMKPLYGQTIFSRLFIERCRRLHQKTIVVVSDCGFQAEYNHVAESKGLFESITVFRLYRDGCTFSNDSREYIYPFGRDCFNHEVEIQNNGTIDDLRTTLSLYLNKIGET